MRISDWSSDVCSSDLDAVVVREDRHALADRRGLRRTVALEDAARRKRQREQRRVESVARAARIIWPHINWLPQSWRLPLPSARHCLSFRLRRFPPPVRVPHRRRTPPPSVPRARPTPAPPKAIIDEERESGLRGKE